MTRKTILTTIMVLTVIVATISASSIAYAATDPKPKDTAKSFFDVFTEKQYTPKSFFDIFTDLQTSSARSDSFFDVFFDAFETSDSFFDVFTELRGDVGNLETQVAEIQSQIGSGGSAQSVDMFIKIDGIEGESTDDKHLNEIDVESWSWGATQSTSLGGGAGGGSGKVSFQDLHFVHKVDKASPKLFLATAKGEHIPKVELTVRKAGDKPLEYMKVTMSDVIISGVSPGTSGDSLPTEEVTMNFAAFEIEYTPQDPKTGDAGTPVKTGWDQKLNKEA
jgi:type VI secretion system secreted protein Hcp